MSGSSTRSGQDLSAIVNEARRAVGCDAMLLTRRMPDGTATLAAAAGMGRGELRRLTPHVHLAEADDEAGTSGGAQLQTALTALRFSSQHRAALRLNGERLGTLHALWRPDAEVRTDLLDAFAAHSAIVLAHDAFHRRVAPLANRLRPSEAIDRVVRPVDNYVALIASLNEAFAEVFGPVLVGVMIWDADEHELQMIPGSLGADEQVAASYRVDARDLHSNASRVLHFRRAYLSNHAAGDPAILQDYVRAFDISRLISLPLLVDQRAVGVLHIANKRSPFGVSDLDTAAEMAARVSMAVEHTQMLVESHRQRQIESVLAKVAETIARGPTDKFLRGALTSLRRATDADLLALVFPGGSPVISRARRASDALRDETLADAAEARRERRKVVKPRGPESPGSAQILMPVHAGGTRVGTLAAVRGRGVPFSRAERRGFARAANLIALFWAARGYQRESAARALLEERHRIADDLHDDVAQLLFAAQMRLDAMLDEGELPPAMIESALRTRELLVRGDVAIRSVIHQLNEPPQEDDIAAQLAEVVAGFEGEHPIPVRLEIALDERESTGPLPSGITRIVVRAAREALVNVAKHAGPCSATVTLGRSDNEDLRLAVTDDGAGLPDQIDPSRHGLRSLERMVAKVGGELAVGPNGTAGARVVLTIPR